LDKGTEKALPLKEMINSNIKIIFFIIF